MTQQTTNETTDLLPCPFCGGAAMIGPTPTMWMVECNNFECSANPDVFKLFKNDAIAAWNRRAALPPTSGEAVDRRRCKPCAATRGGDTCWKCGTPTFEPHPSCGDDPALPPIDRIRALAKEVGYAIGVHGSQQRDFDVIAAPWTDAAIGNHALLEHIAKGLTTDNGPAHIISTERKPLGRYAATIQMDGWYKQLDISVCPNEQYAMPPIAPAAPVADTGAVAGWKLVPVEPTEAMDKAARDECHRMSGVIDPVIHVWDAMLSAAPASPASTAEPVAFVRQGPGGTWIEMVDIGLMSLPDKTPMMIAGSRAPTADSAADARTQRLLKAAKAYAYNYCQDEADLDCMFPFIDGGTQKDEARELFAAINAMSTNTGEGEG